MKTRLTFVVSMAAAVALTAQAPQDRTQPPTFRAGANYVRVDMYATRDGQPVNDLRREEVEVLEDGTPQKIEDFEHVLVRPTASDDVRREVDGLGASREAAGDPRSRVFVVFLDTYHTRLDASAIVRQPLVRFLDRVLGPDDLVALMTPEMAGSDIALGRKTIVFSNILSQEWWGRRGSGTGEDAKEQLYRECFGNEKGVANEMIGRRRERLTLDSLEDLVAHLTGLRDERKAVVLVTEGWVLYNRNPKLAESAAAAAGPVPPQVFKPPVAPPSERGPFSRSRREECETDVHTLAAQDNDLRFREITDDANRSNVTFYPVYARGLSADDAPISGDVLPSPLQDAATLRTRQENMRTLAVETDGEAIINTTNISGALKRIADDVSSYYLFGYYSTNAKLDGRYRTISVQVNRPSVRVRTRRGYRARTAEQVARAAVPDPVRPGVLSALGVISVNSRSSFRIRPAIGAQNGAPGGGTVWVVGELDFRTRREPAWAKGGRAEVVLMAANGEQVGSAQMDVPTALGGFSVRVPTSSPLLPGDYALRIRLRAAGGEMEATETTRVTIPERLPALGEPVLWRRGPSTGPQHVRTADPQFQRSERLRLEFASDRIGATARMLDRVGKPIQVPVQTSERTDAVEGVRWIVADATLAPLAPGDYIIEVVAGDATQITGFRVLP
jgi:VWFA-related protein